MIKLIENLQLPFSLNLDSKCSAYFNNLKLPHSLHQSRSSSFSTIFSLRSLFLGLFILFLDSRSVIAVSFVLNSIADFPTRTIKKSSKHHHRHQFNVAKRKSLQTRLDLITTDRLQTTTAGTRCTTLTGRPGTIITTTRGRPTIVSGRPSPVTGRRPTRSTISIRRTWPNTTSTSNSITATAAAAQRATVRAS